MPITKNTIVVVDDEQISLDTIKRVLEGDYEVMATSSPEEALDIITRKRVKVLLSDLRMPLMSGIDLLMEAKKAAPDVIRVILTGYADTGDIVKAINEANIFRYILKPWNIVDLQQAMQQAVAYYDLAAENKRLLSRLRSANDELENKVRERTRELENANRLLEELALTDPLTGIGNHRYFKQRIRDEISRVQRNNKSLSVIMADIDHFKSFNDNHGHAYGDEVLQKIASILHAGLRGGDLVARYGGEEFIIILPETPKVRAVQISERLRKKIYRETGITISMGVASYPTDSIEDGELVQMADAALYRAKSAGRNQVSV
ncbi:MAG: diguanylate cyclase [Oligoflexia bacterium]|nr:diguanylate cyclase [Oligoflexia bacterium]